MKDFSYLRRLNHICFLPQREFEDRHKCTSGKKISQQKGGLWKGLHKYICVVKVGRIHVLERPLACKFLYTLPFYWHKILQEVCSWQFFRLALTIFKYHASLTYYVIIIYDFKNLVAFGHNNLLQPPVANKGSCDYNDIVAHGHN